ncbi:MAG: sugar phosphate isomerase/epimerase family protein [Novosphingobium sp.]
MAMRWSYALNQWNNGHDRFVLREEHERALKTVSISGFDAVEVPAGSGRWEPLGRKDWIERFYGSLAGFRRQMEACGITAVSSFIFDPAQPIFEEGAFGLSVLNPADHGRIRNTLVQYAEMLPQLGGDLLVVRALPNWSAEVAVDAATTKVAADCWNAVAEMAGDFGVRLALNFDCVSMARTLDDIAMLLERCDAARVGLSIDTADAVIMGIDPVEMYRRFAERVVHVQLKNAREVDSLDEYRLPFPDKFMLAGGGARKIGRWYSELDDADGLVDITAFYRALVAGEYDGWVVVESDQSPMPATSAMLNGWFVRNRLLAGSSVPA